MAKTPRMYGSVSTAIRQRVAQEMTMQTHCTITADMVSYVKTRDRMNIYAAQYGDETILCWVRSDGEFIVKRVCW